MSWDFVFVTRLYIIISCGYSFNRFLNFLQMFYRFIFTSLWCKKNQQNKLEEVKKKKGKELGVKCQCIFDLLVT